MRIKNFVTLLLAGTMLFSTGSVKVNNADYKVGGGIQVFAEDDSAAMTNVTFEVQYMQSDARSMLEGINAFRKGDEAWQWNETNTEKEIVTRLNDLSYDADLEAIAMQRVAEIAVDFDHTRPNGGDTRSYTSNEVKSYGENIAIGTSMSCAEALEGWKETNEQYLGQGHRRNMLREFKAIGIAHAKINGWDCWVQEFGWYEAGNAGTAFDGTKTVTVEVANNRVASCSPDTSKFASSTSLTVGDSMDLPAVVVNSLQLTCPFLGGISCNVDCTWTSSDTSVLEVSDGKAVSKKAGTAILTASPFGKTVLISVEVKEKVTPTPTPSATPTPTATPTPETKPEPKKEWVNSNGNWYYQINGKNQIGWVEDGTTWYYMNSNGVMQTGWLKDNGNWYYMMSSGAMATGWVYSGGAWYYMNASGAMATGWVEADGTWYYMSGSGAMYTGWLKYGNAWYYLTSSGAMATGWALIGGKWYYMYNSGAMATGWVKDGESGSYENWYYLDASGAMRTNSWIASGSKWYYLSESGRALTGTVRTINGKTYAFLPSGEMLSDVCYQIVDQDGTGPSLYMSMPMNDSGILLSGRNVVEGKYPLYTIYLFGADGAALTGWQNVTIQTGDTSDNPIVEKVWVYLASDGRLVGNEWVGNYYVNEDGIMATDAWIGDWYVGSDGLWVPGKTKE